MSAKKVAAVIRCNDARIRLYVEGFLTDAENRRVKARVRKAYDAATRHPSHPVAGEIRGGR